jgi:DNA repair exonuclease SbcCD nuclease subunit
MKFLHTADWQIGMRAAHVGAVAARVREHRLEAARRVVQVARDHQVDFVLVAGDTFEDNAVDRVLVQKVADILAAAGRPVYIIPGNHDPLVPGSIWQHAAWAGSHNIHVVTKAAAIEVPGGALYPCPLFEKHSRKDPTAWIRAGDGDRIAIGLAHGSVEGGTAELLDYPIPRDAAARCGLDYLALGHWHSTGTYPDSSQAVRMAYCGTHETTKFGERDSGNVLVVEIAGRGVVPVVTPVRTGGLIWTTLVEEVREPGDLGRLREKIEAIPDPQDTLLELTLSGVLYPADQPELKRIEELVASRCLFGRVDSVRLMPAPGSDAWLLALPAGPVQDAAREIQAWTGPASDRPAEVTPEIAARALMELYAIVNEVQA